MSVFTNGIQSIQQSFCTSVKRDQGTGQGFYVTSVQSLGN